MLDLILHRYHMIVKIANRIAWLVIWLILIAKRKSLFVQNAKIITRSHQSNQIALQILNWLVHRINLYKTLEHSIFAVLATNRVPKAALTTNQITGVKIAKKGLRKLVIFVFHSAQVDPSIHLILIAATLLTTQTYLSLLHLLNKVQ